MLVLLATLAPALIFSAYQFKRRDLEIERAKQDLGSMARYAADQLDDKARGTVQLLHGMSRAREIDTANKASCSEFLAGVLERYPQYTGLLTITPAGDLHCDSLRSGRRLNVAAREYFRRVSTTLEPAFEVVFGGLTGIAVLQVAYPVLDRRGSLRYVLLASLNLSAYAREFAAASTYPGIRMLIWNQHGSLMASKPDAPGTSLAGREFGSSALFRFAADGISGAAAELPDLDEVQKVWALGVVPAPRGGGALITLGIPRETLLAEANRDLRDALIVLIGAALLAFLASLYMAEAGIRRHVRRIADVAARVGDGDLDARIGAPYPPGELGDLMAVVDGTAVAVQAQHEQIQRSNRTLRVLSGINTLIVRVGNREELFREACRIAVDDGQFLTAWIGTVDREGKRIVPFTAAGLAGHFPGMVGDSLALDDAASADSGPAATAVHGKRPAIINDVARNPGVVQGNAPFDPGGRSIAILPLLIGDEVVAVFGLHAAEAGYFDEAEMKLLRELAGDISFALDHLEKAARLDYLAYYDVLTGLANRNLFLERVSQYIHGAADSGHRLALFLIDLERFKNINDSLGQAAGDALLRQVADWLTRNLGGAKYLARLDADHFAAVMPEVNEEGNVTRVVEKAIEALVTHPFRLNDSVFRVAVKVGVALYPDDGSDAAALFRNAEAALKKAKSSGDRYLFHNQTMTEAVAGKLTLENQLRQALDNGEFVLHFQPKVNLVTGRLTSAEALIRWNDPRTGLVPPGRFIPVLEETGLIYEVGRWAMGRAIEEYLRWRAAGLPAVRIAVNVSPLQLRHRGFIADVERAAGISAQASAGLELEITESLLMEDVQHSITSLKAIRDMGVTIAIDDFGTGFSSLSYLARLPADSLKIDRSFVTGMTAGPQGLSLVSTIINLAHSLKLKVVAEGVETTEQSHLLGLLNCDEMQGYLFSEPVPGEVFEAQFLAANAVRAVPANRAARRG